MLDLNYAEDSHAIVDCNVVMTSKGEFIEVQGTGEGRPFTRIPSCASCSDSASRAAPDVRVQKACSANKRGKPNMKFVLASHNKKS